MSHTSGLDWYFQACSSKYQYIDEVLHDQNMGQQYPEREKGTVDVEMCEETRTDEDASVCSSLTQSSRKATSDATQGIKFQAGLEACKKASG